jgi:hypothetical protein
MLGNSIAIRATLCPANMTGIGGPGTLLNTKLCRENTSSQTCLHTATGTSGSSPFCSASCMTGTYEPLSPAVTCSIAVSLCVDSV